MEAWLLVLSSDVKWDWTLPSLGMGEAQYCPKHCLELRQVFQPGKELAGTRRLPLCFLLSVHLGVYVCADQNKILHCWRQGLNLIPSRLVRLESSAFHERPPGECPTQRLGGIDVMLLHACLASTPW